MIRTEIDSMPTELDVIQRKIIQHEIEEAALKKETDKLSQEHLSEIQKELSDMRDEFNAKKAQWENEKNAIGKVQKLREELEEANAQLEKAQREYDLERAAQLQYGRIPELKKALEMCIRDRGQRDRHGGVKGVPSGPQHLQPRPGGIDIVAADRSAVPVGGGLAPPRGPHVLLLLCFTHT